MARPATQLMPAITMQTKPTAIASAMFVIRAKPRRVKIAAGHISRETRAWLDTRPTGRFEFTFTPKHGSWLNLIEGFFSKFARSVLRHIRVASKHELKNALWPASMTSIAIPSSIPGLISSPRLPDMIRIKETLT